MFHTGLEFVVNLLIKLVIFGLELGFFGIFFVFMSVFMYCFGMYWSVVVKTNIINKYNYWLKKFRLFVNPFLSYPVILKFFLKEVFVVIIFELGGWVTKWYDQTFVFQFTFVNLLIESLLDLNFVVDILIDEFLFLSGTVLNLIELVFIDYIRKSLFEIELIVLIIISLIM